MSAIQMKIIDVI